MALRSSSGTLGVGDIGIWPHTLILPLRILSTASFGCQPFTIRIYVIGPADLYIEVISFTFFGLLLADCRR